MAYILPPVAQLRKMLRLWYAQFVTKLEALTIRQRIARRLLEIEQTIELNELKQSGEQDMAENPALAAFISQMDAATDAIAARIQKLIDNAQGLSAEDTAALQGEVDKLTALGKDPANPIPAPAA